MWLGKWGFYVGRWFVEVFALRMLSFIDDLSHNPLCSIWQISTSGETKDHMLFDYPWVRLVWFGSPHSLHLSHPINKVSIIFQSFSQSFNCRERIGCHNINCSSIFVGSYGNKEISLSLKSSSRSAGYNLVGGESSGWVWARIYIALMHAANVLHGSDSISGRRSVPSPIAVRWSRPPHGFLKVNCDRAFHSQSAHYNTKRSYTMFLHSISSSIFLDHQRLSSKMMDINFGSYKYDVVSCIYIGSFGRLSV